MAGRLPAPDERSVLPSYRPAPNLPARRDPMDLESFLRSQGGLLDQFGELSHLGIGNKPRDVEFAKSEGFLGPLVSDGGRNLDDAAQAAWERTGRKWHLTISGASPISEVTTNQVSAPF